MSGGTPAARISPITPCAAGRSPDSTQMLAPEANEHLTVSRLIVPKVGVLHYVLRATWLLTRIGISLRMRWPSRRVTCTECSRIQTRPRCVQFSPQAAPSPQERWFLAAGQAADDCTIRDLHYSRVFKSVDSKLNCWLALAAFAENGGVDGRQQV